MNNEIQNMGNIKDKLAGKFEHIVPEGVQRIFEVEIDKVRRYEEQARKVFDEENLSELAESIQRHGQLMPIILKREDGVDTYLLVAGERRYRACQKLGKTSINAVLTSGDPAEINLIENVQREDLHPLDLAERLNQMIQEHGYSQGQLSEVVNKPRKTINEILMLVNLPEQIKTGWRSASSVPKTTLLQIARAGSEDKQMSLWEQVRGGNLSYREVKEKRHTKSSSKTPASTELLRSGQRFIKKLRGASGLNQDEVSRLSEIQQEINTLVTLVLLQSK